MGQPLVRGCLVEEGVECFSDRRGLFLGGHVAGGLDHGEYGGRDARGGVLAMAEGDDLIAGTVDNGSRAADGAERRVRVWAVDGRLQLGAEGLWPDLVGCKRPKNAASSASLRWLGSTSAGKAAVTMSS